jgi:hypothetical protein
MKDKNCKLLNEDRRNEKKILGLERNIFFVGTTSFLTDTATKMIYAIMPLFLMTLGATKTEISLIEGISESTASIYRVSWWAYLQRLGQWLYEITKLAILKYKEIVKK